jgi:hypothetical protein
LRFIVSLLLTISIHANAQSSAVGESNAITNHAVSPATINQGANQGKASQSNGSMMNMAAAGMLMAACMASTPPNMALCAMGALALMQAGKDDGAAGQSAGTALTSLSAGQGSSNSTNPGTTAGTTPGASGPGSATDGGSTGGYADPNIAAGLAALGQNGITVTPKGVTTADGVTTPASAFSSSAGMTAAGFDGAGAAKAVAAIRAALADSGMNAARVSGVALNEGGGGGNGGGGNLEPLEFKAPKLNGLEKAQDANKLVADKSVMFGGDPIGVSVDNIFGMIHRAYDKKRESKDFIDEAHPYVKDEIRVPASYKLIH